MFNATPSGGRPDSRRAIRQSQAGRRILLRRLRRPLRQELQELGFVIDRQGGKKWEIAGITPAMIDTFSKRKDEVEDAARRLGITDPARKAELGAKTRSKKQKELTMPELREAWWAQLTDDERDALASGLCAARSPPASEVTAARSGDRSPSPICRSSARPSPERELKRDGVAARPGQRHAGADRPRDAVAASRPHRR